VLEDYKGLDVLLTAWRTVLDRHPAAVLTLAGAGPREADLRAQARELGLDTSVRFLGFKSRPDLAELFDAASFMVLPSRSEGLPRVVVEAMARGRAVVATKVGGLAQLVHEGQNGHLVDAEDPAALADALSGLIADPVACATMGRRARAFVEQLDPVAEYEAGMAGWAAWASHATAGPRTDP
jgi:glycosyltransferase involved in cell wall biosynthesis